LFVNLNPKSRQWRLVCHALFGYRLLKYMVSDLHSFFSFKLGK